MTERMTISMPDDLAERINGQLGYGDNRSELVRDLLREALDEREKSVDHEDSEEDTALPAELATALAEYREQCEQYDPDRADARVAAARAIMERMVAEDGISKSRAQEDLLPEHDIEEQSAATWWRKNGKDILGQIERVEYQSGRNEYVFDAP